MSQDEQDLQKVRKMNMNNTTTHQRTSFGLVSEQMHMIMLISSTSEASKTRLALK